MNAFRSGETRLLVRFVFVCNSYKFRKSDLANPSMDRFQYHARGGKGLVTCFGVHVECKFTGKITVTDTVVSRKRAHSERAPTPYFLAHFLV